MSDFAKGASSLDSVSPSDGILLRVTPEPTPQEIAAIAAAVHLLQSAAAGTTAPEGLDRSDKLISRWARAGRLEAMQGLLREPSDFA